MTKICGALDFAKSEHELSKLILNMASSMKHQEWHKINTFSDKTISLGYINISMPDDSIQPIWYNDKCIVMCGNLVDYEEDKKLLIKKGYKFKFNNNAEFILFAIEELGEDYIKKLNGIFTFAIWDRKNQKLILVNDRYGYRPVYFYHDKSKLIFASEIKAVIKDKSIERKVRWSAWADFIYLGTILGDKTFFENIFALSPASILTFEKGNQSDNKNNKIKIKKYWEPAKIKCDKENTSEFFVQKGKALIEKSIERETRNINEADCFLTGGFDSRCIAMIIKNQNKIKLQTYTTLKEGDNNNDKIFGKEVADFLGLENTFVELPDNLYEKYFLKTFYLTDGMLNEHLFLMPIIEKLDRKKYNFDGIVGDILLKGSFTNEHKINPKIFEKLVLPKERDKIVDKIFTDKIANDIKKSIRESIKENINMHKDSENYITLFYLMNEGRRKVALSSMMTTLLKKESLLPFLDNDFVEFALKIPRENKSKDKIYIKILDRINSECMKIPSTHGHSNKRNIIKNFMRRSTVRKTRNQIYFRIMSNNFLMKIIQQLLSYKRYSEENIKIERKISDKLTKIDSILKSNLVHKRDIFSKYHLHFSLWYNMFFIDRENNINRILD